MSREKQNKTTEQDTMQRNTDRQGTAKAPGEEKGKKEKVTPEDLKGKKVDADPEKESDQPAK